MLLGVVNKYSEMKVARGDGTQVMDAGQGRMGGKDGCRTGRAGCIYPARAVASIMAPGWGIKPNMWLPRCWLAGPLLLDEASHSQHLSSLTQQLTPTTTSNT